MTIIPIETVASTNRYLKESARNRVLEEGTVIAARNQTEGKGQRGNAWESEAGKNITCSMLLYPSFLPAQSCFLLSEAVALGVKETLDVYVSGISLKWPNDVYHLDRKIAGILIENEFTGNRYHSSVVGIGVNINQERFLSNAPNPISLKQITGRDHDTEALLKELARNILRRYEQLKAGDTKSLTGMYQDALYRKTGFHRFEDDEGIFIARIDRVSDDGFLHLVTDGEKERSYAFKTVRFL